MIGIDPDKPIAPILDQKQRDAQVKTNKNQFQDVFQQAMDSVKTDHQKVESPPFVSDIRPVQFETAAEPSANLIADRVGQLIDTMETYQRQLSDAGTTLREMESTMEKIAQQSESLSAISKGMEMEDDLRAIVNQSLALSSKEVARYKSGHYNDA